MIRLPIGRRGARKVLFYAESPVKYAMFRPLHRRLLDDPRFEVFFAGKLRGEQHSKGMAATLGVEQARPLRRGIAALVAFDLFFSADYRMWSPFRNRRLPIGATPKVQLFHGVSVRNGAIQKAMRTWDHLFVVGPYMQRRLVEEGILEAGDPRMIPVGMPKTDRMVDGTVDVGLVRRTLRLDPARPTVMLAPTFVRSSALNAYGVALLERLAGGPWNLLIKLHDKFFDPRFNLTDWRARLAPFATRENCRVVDDYDAVPYLLASDVLISDVSSIANEFLLLDRPLVYLKLQDEQQVRAQYPMLDLETWGQRLGDAVGSADECFGAVEQAIAEPTRHAELRRAAAQDLFFHPGNATAAAADACYRVLGLERPAGRTPAREESLQGS